MRPFYLGLVVAMTTSYALPSMQHGKAVSAQVSLHAPDLPLLAKRGAIDAMAPATQHEAAVPATRTQSSLSAHSRFILGTLPHEPHARFQQFKQGATQLRADSSMHGESKAFYDSLPLPDKTRFGRHDVTAVQAEDLSSGNAIDTIDDEEARRQLKGGSGGRGGSRGSSSRSGSRDKSYAYAGGHGQNKSGARARADVRDSVIGQYVFRPVRAAAQQLKWSKSATQP